MLNDSGGSFWENVHWPMFKNDSAPIRLITRQNLLFKWRIYLIVVSKKRLLMVFLSQYDSQSIFDDKFRMTVSLVLIGVCTVQNFSLNLLRQWSSHVLGLLGCSVSTPLCWHRFVIVKCRSCARYTMATGQDGLWRSPDAFVFATEV